MGFIKLQEVVALSMNKLLKYFRNSQAFYCFILFFLAGLSLYGVKENAYPGVLIASNIVWLFFINVFFACSLYRFSRNVVCLKSFADELLALTITAFTNILIFANFYATYGIKNGGDVVYDSLASLYFSVVTWTTLGYGDYSPEGGLRFVAALEALMGYTYMAILVGLFLTMFSKKFDGSPADSEGKASD